MVRVEDVEVAARATQAADPRRVRHRQRELRIGRGRDRRDSARRAGRASAAPGKRGREHPRLVAARLEAAPERLHRDRDAAAERQVVVGEERDPHGATPGQALLYFSKSSGLMFCSHSRSCSGSSALTGSRFLGDLQALPALRNDLLVDEDRRGHAQGERDGVGRARVDRVLRVSPSLQVEHREEGVLLEVGDHDLEHLRRRASPGCS